MNIGAIAGAGTIFDLGDLMSLGGYINAIAKSAEKFIEIKPAANAQLQSTAQHNDSQ
jgi:hypothetical protein